MTTRLVVFDLDGTLIDSLRDLAESANALLEECGAAPLSHETVAAMVGEGAALLVARVFAAAGCPQPADGLARFLAIYDARPLQHTRPYEGVQAVLEALVPRYRLAVLTNKPLGITRTILRGLALDGYFPGDHVIGGDGPFPRKPDPAGLRHLMALAGAAPSETVMVGDSPIDCQTARAASSRASIASYGFGFRDDFFSDLHDGDLVLRHVSDLLDAV